MNEKLKHVVSYDHLFQYKATLSSHIYMVLRNTHELYQDDVKGTNWQGIFLKLLDDKKIDRKKVMDNIYRANIPGDRREYR